LNRRPLPCQGSALPLSYVPVVKSVQSELCLLRCRIDREPARVNKISALGNQRRKPLSAGFLQSGARWVVGQQAFAGDVVYFEADAFGIFEQNRIVTGRPFAGLGSAYDLRTEFIDECVDRINVLA
jgi:hypothetical protein